MNWWPPPVITASMRSRCSITRACGGSAQYTGALVAALEQVWRAANGICGKRLVPALPAFVAALARHGALQLDAATRAQLLARSPVTADRRLKRARSGA